MENLRPKFDHGISESETWMLCSTLPLWTNQQTEN